MAWLHTQLKRPLSLFCSVFLHFSSFCLFVGHLLASAGLFACGSLLVNWAYCPGMVIQHFDGLWKSPNVRLDQAGVGGAGVIH